MDKVLRLVLPRASTASSTAARRATAAASAASCGRKSRALVVYAVLLACTYFGFQLVPPGFVPTQDKQYLVSFAQLPDGATLDRTEAVIRQMSDIALKEPGVESAVAFPGLSINGFINSAERRHRVRHAQAVRRARRRRTCPASPSRRSCR